MKVMLKNDTCPIESSATMYNCNRPVRYWISWHRKGEHIGAMICGTHDRSIGRANLQRWKPELSRQQIVDLDNRLTKEAKLDLANQ